MGSLFSNVVSLSLIIQILLSAESRRMGPRLLAILHDLWRCALRSEARYASLLLWSANPDLLLVLPTAGILNCRYDVPEGETAPPAILQLIGTRRSSGVGEKGEGPVPVEIVLALSRADTKLVSVHVEG
jgi:hypothetical protein